ncbi:hypothetical protein HPC49_47555, partial [Pyxidicoccus fallax]
MRGAKLVAWGVCLVLLGGTPPAARAQPSPPRDGSVPSAARAQASPTRHGGGNTRTTDERSVESLRDALQTLRSPAVRQLRAAQDALSRQPEEALRLAALPRQDPLFAPYGLQIEAVLSRTQARELLAGGKRAEALEAANKALTLFQRAAESCPSPVMARKLPEELGRTEAVAGEAHHARQEWAEAQRLYESAFTHFADVDLLRGFQPESLGRYAESCARQAKPSVSPTCAEWLRRFIQLEGRGSPKGRAITKHVPLEALGPFP